MFYKVIAQFAKANAPSFRTPGFEEHLVEAKDYFNIRSRVATNPKEITELTIIDDKTIRIIFRSQEILNISQISRSLRVFSMYLVDETHSLNFSNLISGKRLFRMSASEYASGSEENTSSSDENERGNNSSAESNLLLLKKIFEIMECSNDVEARNAIAAVDTVVEDFFRKRRG